VTAVAGCYRGLVTIMRMRGFAGVDPGGGRALLAASLSRGAVMAAGSWATWSCARLGGPPAGAAACVVVYGAGPRAGVARTGGRLAVVRSGCLVIR
jgi:hypothetical protein